MALDYNSLVNAMVSAGENLGGTLWHDIETYAVPELKKIAIQIIAIETDKDSYTPAGAQALMDMQIKATIGVIVAMTTLTLLAVQSAINQILDAVKSMVNTAIGFGVIP
jgi:hypothetical protein